MPVGVTVVAFLAVACVVTGVAMELYEKPPSSSDWPITSYIFDWAWFLLWTWSLTHLVGVVGTYVPIVGVIAGLATAPFTFVRHIVGPTVANYVQWAIFTRAKRWNFQVLVSLCSGLWWVVNTAAYWISSKIKQRQMYTFINAATIALIVSLVWFAVGYCAKENNDFIVIMQFWTIRVSYNRYQSGNFEYDFKHDGLQFIYRFVTGCLVGLPYFHDAVYVKVATEEKKGNAENDEVVRTNILAVAHMGGSLGPVEAIFLIGIQGFRENPGAPVTLNGGVYPSEEFYGVLCDFGNEFYSHFRENCIAFWVLATIEALYYNFGNDPVKWAFMPLCDLIMNTNNCQEIFRTFMSVFDAPGWFTWTPSIYTHLLQAFAASVILLIGACSIACICYEMLLFAWEKISGSAFKNVDPGNHQSFTMKMVSWAHVPRVYGYSLCLYMYLSCAPYAFAVVLAVTLKCTLYRQNHFMKVWDGEDGHENHFQVVSHQNMNIRVSPNIFCWVYASVQTEAPTQDEVVTPNRFREAWMWFCRVFPAAWTCFCNMFSVVLRSVGRGR